MLLASQKQIVRDIIDVLVVLTERLTYKQTLKLKILFELWCDIFIVLRLKFG